MFTINAHSDFVSSVRFTDDRKKILSAGGDGKIKVWDFKSKENLRTLEGNFGPVHSIEIRNNVVISGGLDRTIRVWDFETGNLYDSAETRSEAIRSMGVSIDNSFVASGSNDRVIEIFCKHGRGVQYLDAGSGAKSLQFCSNSRKIFSGHIDGTIRIWTSKVPIIY